MTMNIGFSSIISEEIHEAFKKKDNIFWHSDDNKEFIIGPLGEEGIFYVRYFDHEQPGVKERMKEALEKKEFKVNDVSFSIFQDISIPKDGRIVLLSKLKNN